MFVFQEPQVELEVFHSARNKTLKGVYVHYRKITNDVVLIRAIRADEALPSPLPLNDLTCRNRGFFFYPFLITFNVEWLQNKSLLLLML